MIDTQLKDKVVLVTGAQHGIGAATAQAFAAEGAQVLVHYFRVPLNDSKGSKTRAESPSEPGEALYRARQATSAEDLIQEILRQGGKAEAVEADLSDPTSVPMLFDRAEKAFGPVEVLVNNAAHGELDTFLPRKTKAEDKTTVVQLMELWTDPPPPITPESHDRHFAVNTRAVVLMMAEFFHRRLEQEHDTRWGRIINVSTDGAYCHPGAISYGASKFALEAYSRSAAMEMAKFGIMVNIVSPGPIQTGYITRELEERILPDIPLGRLGRPEDVADVIVFLASEQAHWLTGQLLQVGGGHKM